MPSDLEQLHTIRRQILAELASLTALRKPTYSVDGQTFSWNDYRSRLLSDLREVDELIAGEQPFEARTQGTT